MDYDEWMKRIADNPDLIRSGDDKDKDYKSHNEKCVVKENIPLPVEVVSSAITPEPEKVDLNDPTKTGDIEIFDQAGNYLT